MQKNMNLRQRFFLTILFLAVLSLLSMKAFRGFFPFPMFLRHFFHLAVGPKDIYEPILVDTFKFYEKGFSKTYLLQVKYLDSYEIGFLSTKQNIAKNYEFDGKLKVEFLYKNKLIFESVTTSILTAGYAEGDMEHYKEVSLLDFVIPLKGRYKNHISVKLTVLEPDKQLENFGDSIKLYIGVSATP